jgi:hypothetical protein
MCKVAVGASLYKQLNIECFLKQRKALDNDFLSGLTELSLGHPYHVKRIQALQAFFESDHYRRLTQQVGAK